MLDNLLRREVEIPANIAEPLLRELMFHVSHSALIQIMIDQEVELGDGDGPLATALRGCQTRLAALEELSV